MKNPSAIGVAGLVSIAAAMMVNSSSADSNYQFRGSQQTLGKILTGVNWQTAMQAYQRQTSTITLKKENLTSPHLLRVELPDGTTLQGHITINNETQVALNATTDSIDLSPHLKGTSNEIVITGSYAPTAGPVLIRFKGPDTFIQQQTGSDGQLNFQLTLLVG